MSPDPKSSKDLSGLCLSVENRRPDLKAFPALCDGYAYLIYIGAKGYVGAETEALAWERGRHQLLPLRRANQHEQ